MKKFEMLGKSLSKGEMKKVMGGVEDESVDGGDVRRGMCSAGESGTWYYTPPVSYSRCGQDIQAYCGSGLGSCFTW